MTMERVLASGRIPADLIVPRLQRYLDTYETTGWFEYEEDAVVYGGDGGNKENFPGSWIEGPSPIGVLAGEAKCDPTTLAKMLRGETKTVGWDLADRLLCKIGDSLYLHDHHRDVYYGVTLRDERECRHGVRIMPDERFVDHCTRCAAEAARSSATKKRKRQRMLGELAAAA